MPSDIGAKIGTSQSFKYVDLATRSTSECFPDVGTDYIRNCVITAGPHRRVSTSLAGRAGGRNAVTLSIKWYVHCSLRRHSHRSIHHGSYGSGRDAAVSAGRLGDLGAGPGHFCRDSCFVPPFEIGRKVP